MGAEHKTNWAQIAALILALLGWAFTGMRAYGDDKDAVKQRMSVVETKQTEAEKRFEAERQRQDKWMERIEDKLDRALARDQVRR